MGWMVWDMICMDGGGGRCDNYIKTRVEMSFVSDYLTPFLEFYGRVLDGPYLAQQLQYKGSQEIGGDYVNKVHQSQRRAITERYDSAFQAVQSPSLSGFLSDNIPRLLLNPFDRLIAAYQAYPSLKSRFVKPGTFSHTFTEIMNEGVFLGAFKGLIFNVTQLGAVLYPAVYFANKNGSENKFLTFLTTYTVLDALFYPVDTLKNILYADTLGKYNLKTVANAPYLLDLYRGLFLKLAYNLPVLSGIYCTTQTDLQTQAWLSWAAAAILYPINTLKVRAQVSGTPLSTITPNTGAIFHSAYRGVVPFILINALVGYSLRPLFSQGKLAEINNGVQEELKEGRF